jgi:transcription termination factor Rho
MAVLQRKELEQSPLADLHAIASELGVEGYRALRKADLIDAILAVQGGEDGGAAESSKEPDAPSDDEAPAEEAPEDEDQGEAEPEPAHPRQREWLRARRPLGALPRRRVCLACPDPTLRAARRR